MQARRPRGADKNGKGLAMRYRVYSGPSGTQSISPLEKDKLLFKEFGILDEAFAWAEHVGTTGRVALLIEGDDGTHMTKHEIASALRHREGQTAL
jgi:hypothetical protein